MTRAGARRPGDRDNLATIGRAAAVADIKRVGLSGFLAWATWLVVHLWYLIGFQNRLLVLIRWSFSFAIHGFRSEPRQHVQRLTEVHLQLPWGGFV